jgi:hypothetical protein
VEGYTNFLWVMLLALFHRGRAVSAVGLLLCPPLRWREVPRLQDGPEGGSRPLAI